MNEEELKKFQKEWGLPVKSGGDIFQPLQDLADEEHDGRTLSPQEMNAIGQAEIDKINCPQCYRGLPCDKDHEPKTHLSVVK